MEYSSHLPPLLSIISNHSKLKVLFYLAKEEETNITSIGKFTGLNHSRLTDVLDELKRDEIILEKNFGRIRVFLINESNEAGFRIKSFIRKWNRDVTLTSD